MNGGELAIEENLIFQAHGPSLVAGVLIRGTRTP